MRCSQVCFAFDPLPPQKMKGLKSFQNLPFLNALQGYELGDLGHESRRNASHKNEQEHRNFNDFESSRQTPILMILGP